MTEDAHRTGDNRPDDVTLHHWTGARMGAGTLAPGEHVPTEQAADALTADLVERQSSHPHVVVTSVDPRTAQLFDEPAKLLEVREHIGPFPERRSAERWARRHYADKPNVAWTTAPVHRPAWVEEDVRRLREPMGPPLP